MGLVSTAFKPEDLLKLRYGNLGIGHTRYSTTGMSELQNCQPFVVDTLHGKIAVAHNGELVNAAALRKKAGLYFFSDYGGLFLCTKRSMSLNTPLCYISSVMKMFNI